MVWAIFSDPEVAGDIFADVGVVNRFRHMDALLTQNLEQRLFMLMRPAIGFARFTVSSYMIYR